MKKSFKKYVICTMLLILAAALMFTVGFTYLCIADTNSGQNYNVINVEIEPENDTIDITIYQKDIELIAKTIYGVRDVWILTQRSRIFLAIGNNNP